MKYILLLVLLVVSCHPALAKSETPSDSVNASFVAAQAVCSVYATDEIKDCMLLFGFRYSKALASK